VTFLYTWFDRALVIAFLPLTDLGVYDISFKAFNVLTAMATALGQSLFPYYGMAYGRKDLKAIGGGIKKASRYTMLIIFPLTLGLVSTAKPVITLFAGQQYELGWTILAILSVFGLTYGLSSALGLSPTFSGLLLIYEKTKTVLLVSLVPVISSFGLLPLLWIAGLNGLAVMRGASLLFTFLLTVYSISKIVKIEVDKQTFIKTLFSSAVMASAVLAAQQFYYNIYLLPVYVLVGAFVYLTGIRLLKVLNKADIKLFEQVLGERTAKYVTKILVPNKKPKTSG
jgi:O-antigen/teichoic acid export membrane protein